MSTNYDSQHSVTVVFCVICRIRRSLPEWSPLFQACTNANRRCTSLRKWREKERNIEQLIKKSNMKNYPDVEKRNY